MKATIEIPDDLYRKVQAKSARQGRPVQDVAVELLGAWVEEDTATSGQALRTSREQWLNEWFQMADEAFKNAPPGPTAREILEQDRNRLER